MRTEEIEKGKRTRYHWKFLLYLSFLSLFVPPAGGGRVFYSRYFVAVLYFLKNSLLHHLGDVSLLVKLVVLGFGVWTVFKRESRAFKNGFGFLLLWCSFTQGIALLPKGFGVLPPVLIGCAASALAWFSEKDILFKMRRMNGVEKGLLALSFLSFLYPVGEGGALSFSPNTLLFGVGGTAFCSVVPFYLLIARACCDKKGCLALTLTALWGLTFAFANLAVSALFLQKLWWYGTVHLPLLISSLFVLVSGYPSKNLGRTK